MILDLDIGIDFDNSAGFQCVDVYREYLEKVLKVPQSPKVVGAADIWTTYRKEDFVAIPNIIGNMNNYPLRGDIFIYKRSKSNNFLGHVGIVVTANGRKVVLLEQDGLVRSKLRVRQADYTNSFGWLRKKENAI